jgi:hypothetical protein
MKDEISQIMALVAYGNAYLQGKQVAFEKNHPAGFHYDKIRFVETIPKDLLARKPILAENPNAWFKFLYNNGVNRLYLSLQSSSSLGLEDHISSAFVGGGSQWNIIAVKGEKCDIWQTKWQMEFGDLKVYYFQLLKNVDMPKIPKTTLGQAEKYLSEILKDMVDFTQENDLTNWVKVFQTALDLLSIEEPHKLLQKGYLPNDCFKLKAEQILTACDHAWVFGGMGSWNDVVRVKNYDLYTRLSANLYDTLCKAMIAAINSYP